jgi:CheY-like chemotaxis protein/HPt (histidine-containing phosphotransfer) domain-containing protein
MSYDPDMVADVVANLRGAFLEEANDKVLQMAALCNAAATADGNAVEDLRALRRELHSLKGQGTAFGFETITVLAHRLEDLLDTVAAGAPWSPETVLRYVEKIDDVVEAGVDPGAEGRDAMLAELADLRIDPRRAAVDGDAPPPEVLLVCKSRTIRFKATREIEAYGFSVVAVAEPLQAMAHAARTQPACVFCSATLEGLSGFDLIHALAAMPSTRAIPGVLLTSFDADHPDVRVLPDGVGVVQLDQTMSDGIARAFSSLELRRAAVG